jgi:hypothetical protein
MEPDTNTGAPIVTEKTSTSSIISIIVIVLVLALGAFYFLQQVPLATEGGELTPAEMQADKSISDLSTQGTSTDLADIQKDLDATNLSGLDAGLSDIAI